MLSNKAVGNRFETDLCERLSRCGFWAHNMAMNRSGQPADVIAVRDGKSFLIDCKDCANKTFPFKRIEENQHLSMNRWKECGNGTGWFALRLDGEIYMVAMSSMMSISRELKVSGMSEELIKSYGIRFATWVTIC